MSYTWPTQLGKYDNIVKFLKKFKIYDDIIPIFTTMIGIMKKQEFEIDALKSKLEILIVFRDKF